MFCGSLRIRANQLGAWERSGLIACRSSYSFGEIVQLRKLRDLRAARLSTASIRASVDAMQAVSGMRNPLLETGVMPMHSGLAFRLSGAMVDPIARQFLFDFDSQILPAWLKWAITRQTKPLARFVSPTCSWRL